ncbi:MAG: hypothetical protein KDD03_06200 [Gelidibacter sp.]|nr:hypothetical protein [Gelidibacter sp.]
MKFLQPLFLLMLSVGCNTQTTYFFTESQSKTIDAYRRQGFYEYATPLNNDMWLFLKTRETDLASGTILRTIEKVNKRVSKEKNVLGCYIIPWTKNKRDLVSNDVIMLEWNHEEGVVIRLFTKSEIVKENLPSQSF